jgi:hypothetical protein
MFRALLLLLALLALPAATVVVEHARGPSYTGPGDIVSGATAWYGLRAYNAAYAATPGKSVNVRRASDNVSCDVNVATTGGLGLTTATCNSSTQGGITPTAFAGTDATATCTLATTTATCASASSTPHVGSTITGAGLTQPCLITAVGTFTAGAGTLTTSLAGTSTSCGTISVGETFTMTYGLFVTEAYDQTGNGNNVTQATAGNQPQFLPIVVGTLPGMLGKASNTVLAGTIANVNQPTTMVAESIWTVPSGEADLVTTGTANNALSQGVQYFSSATFAGYAGSRQTVTVTNGLLYSTIGVLNGASGVIVTNGTAVTKNMGTNATGTFIEIMGRVGTNNFAGYFFEGGLWPIAFNSTQYGNMATNQAAYW